MWSKSLKGPSTSESEETEISFFFFSGILTVSLVTVRLVVLRFFFIFVSVLGDVVTVDGEGLAVAVPGVGVGSFNKFPSLIGAGQHRSWLVEGKRWLNPRWTGHCG